MGKIAGCGIRTYKNKAEEEIRLLREIGKNWDLPG